MENSVSWGISLRRAAAACLLALALPLWANAQASKLNPMLRHLRAGTPAQQPGFSPAGESAFGAQSRIRLLLRLRPGVDKSALAARYPGARFATQTGAVVTGEMPLADIDRLAGDPDVLAAEASVSLRYANDIVRSSVTDSGKYLGVLDPGVTDFRTEEGTGVIVGIIDSGIDWKHGDFIIEGTPDRSRVLYIWDQGDTVGPAPGGAYAYGTEWTQAQINAELGAVPPGIVRSSDTVGHGTHVAAIAAGDGSATDGDIPAGTFRGMAADAELIVVKTSLGSAEVLDGVNYVFQKAAALGRRAVVNLSLVSDSGPHDGTDAYSTALETIAQSSPVVTSAGNSGSSGIHASSLTAHSGTVMFAVQRHQLSNGFAVDFWVPSGDEYTVSVATVAAGGGAVAAVSGLDVNSGTLETTTVDIYNTPGAHPSGDRELLVVIREEPNILPSDFYITLTRTGNSGSGQIHGWITPAVSSFTTYESSLWTISDGATADSAIVVGSYCGKREWTDTDDTPVADTECLPAQIGKLSNFSGLGPTRDGRVKPDMTAPGEYVASALSADSSPSSLVILKDGRHTVLQGTSMSAPVVTGMVAIDLQRFPAKSAAAVKATLQTNARADAPVTSSGTVPNPFWGYGKATHFACLAAAITPPTAVTATALGHSSITVSWAAANFADSYNVYYATDTGTLITQTAATSFIFTGLQPSTTYAVEVRGNSPCGEGPGAVSAEEETGAPPPLSAAPLAPVGSAIDTRTLQWVWNSVQYADSYDVVPATNTSAAPINSVTPGVFHTGLDTNTAYGVVVGGRNDSGRGPLSPAATVYTSAAQPTGLSTTAVYVASAALSWGLNGNPAYTTASLERSTDNVVFTEISSGAFSSVAAMELAGCTSYYFRVRNRNGDGVPTSYDTTLNFLTLNSTPLVPGGLSAESLSGRRIGLSWSAAPSEDVVGYALYYDNGGGVINYSATMTTFAAQTLSYVTDPLPGLETEYRFGLRAVNRCGVEETNVDVAASAVALEALSGLRAAVTVPASGQRVEGDRVTVAADIVLGSVDDAREVRFEFKAASAAAWSLLPAADSLRRPNPDPDYPYAVHWDVLGLDATSYHLRAVTTDIHSSTDAFAPVVTVVVDHAGYDISETLQAGGRISKQQRIHNGAAGTVESSDQATALTTRVVIPAGSLSDSTVTVTLVNNPSTALNPPAGAADLGLRAQITLSNGQTDLAGGNRAALTFKYPDANGDGLVDGTTYRADELQIYVYDLTAGAWRQEFASSVDASRRTVTGSTPHFSFFAVFASAASGLDAVRVYPNPYRPGNAGADDGVAYDPANLNSGIVFDRLPVDFKINIYTLTGEWVARILPRGSGTRVQWDARNSAGAAVASGVYFAVVSSPDHEPVVKKVAVIR